MALGRMKYRSRSRRSYSYAVRHGDYVSISGRIRKHGGSSERTRTRTRREPDVPRASQNRQRLAGRRQESMPASAPAQESLGSRIGTAIQSPAGRAAVDLAARALAARLGIPPALLPPRDLLALPPPRD